MKPLVPEVRAVLSFLIMTKVTVCCGNGFFISAEGHFFTSGARTASRTVRTSGPTACYNVNLEIPKAVITVIKPRQREAEFIIRVFCVYFQEKPEYSG